MWNDYFSLRLSCGLSMILLALVGSHSSAHDFWIEPSTFSPRTGSVVGIRLWNGQGLAGEPFPRRFRHISRFDVTCSDRTQEVQGLEGADPAGLILAQTDGVYLIAYESHLLSTQPSASDHQRNVTHQRMGVATGEPSSISTPHQGAEWFARCAKSIIRVGTGEFPEAASQILGLTTEIIPLQDPSSLHLGDTLNVRLLCRGYPVPDIPLNALNIGNLEAPVVTRTNAAGEAEFALNHPGFWLIRSVICIPSLEMGTRYSYWASLTFELNL